MTQRAAAGWRPRGEPRSPGRVSGAERPGIVVRVLGAQGCDSALGDAGERTD
jgi:hypothetical protein